VIDILIGLAVAAAPSTATPSLQPATPVPQNSQPIVVRGQQDPEKRVLCISSTPTGSILAKRVCNTQARWEELHRKGDQLAQQIMQQQVLDQATVMRKGSEECPRC
jgi:hypothetical protein